jgi:hypothetical protein
MLDMVGAAAISDQGQLKQYACTKPIDFAPVVFDENPDFFVGPADAQIRMSGAVIDTYHTTVSGTFSEDGTEIYNADVKMVIDGRDVYSSFGFDVCSLLKCVACPDGAKSCVQLDVLDASSPAVSGVPVDAHINPADYPECR